MMVDLYHFAQVLDQHDLDADVSPIHRLITVLIDDGLLWEQAMEVVVGLRGRHARWQRAMQDWDAALAEIADEW